MSHKTAATVGLTIGIDTGKNTLHLIGLDDKGAIVLREKIARGRITALMVTMISRAPITRLSRLSLYRFHHSRGSFVCLARDNYFECPELCHSKADLCRTLSLVGNCGQLVFSLVLPRKNWQKRSASTNARRAIGNRRKTKCRHRP